MLKYRTAFKNKQKRYWAFSAIKAFSLQNLKQFKRKFCFAVSV